MTIHYDGFGAMVTTSIHEVDDHRTYPRTETTPAECWIRCVCGWEWDSQESAGGPVGSMRDAWQEHLDMEGQNE